MANDKTLADAFLDELSEIVNDAIDMGQNFDKNYLDLKLSEKGITEDKRAEIMEQMIMVKKKGKRSVEWEFKFKKQKKEGKKDE